MDDQVSIPVGEEVTVTSVDASSVTASVGRGSGATSVGGSGVPHPLVAILEFVNHVFTHIMTTFEERFTALIEHLTPFYNTTRESTSIICYTIQYSWNTNACHIRWFLFLAIMFTSIEAPFDLAFKVSDKGRQILHFIELGCSLVFLTDDLLSFKIPEMCTVSLFSYYLYEFFATSTLGLQWLVDQSWFEFFRLLSIFRLFKLTSIYSRWEKTRTLYSLRNRWRSQYCYFRGLKLILVSIYMAHISACMIYLLTVQHSDVGNTWLAKLSTNGNNMWGRYMASFYWSWMTLSTVGYGDFSPINTRERGLICIFLFLTIVFTGYIVGNITQLFVTLTGRRKIYVDHYQAALEFFRLTDAPEGFKTQVLERLKVNYQLNIQSMQNESFFDSLPSVLRFRILEHLFQKADGVGQSIYLFKGLSETFLSELVMNMDIEFFPASSDVILVGGPPTDIYILVDGAATQYIAVENGQRTIDVGRGGVLGELAVFCHKLQPFTYRTTQFCLFLRLSCTSLKAVARSSERDVRTLMMNILQHWRDSEEQAVINVLQEICNLIITTTGELVLIDELSTEDLFHHFMSFC